jgi:hypothetical protein
MANNIIDITNERKIIKTFNNTEYINIYQYNTTSHVYTPSEGGTGITSYTIGDLLVATNATTLSVLSDIATTNVLLSTGVGVIPSFGKVNLAITCDNVLPIASGGTNISSYTTGDLLYASGTNVLNTLSDIETGNVLLSGGVGVAPSYGKVDLTSAITGILPVANGGTNLTTYTTGDLIYASGTNILNTLPDIATTNVLLSGGVGVAPSYGKVNLTTAVSNVLPLANGGTGASNLPLGIITSNGSVLSSVSIGSAYNVVVYNSGALSFVPSTFIRSSASTSTSSIISCATVIPDDNTIPTNTEGNSILSASYSANATGSTIIIYVSVNTGTLNSSSNMMISVFTSKSSSAIAVGYVNFGSSVGNCTILVRYISPDTSTITYSVRCGGSVGTTFLNGSNTGAARFNGTLTSRMFITEYSTN